MTIPDSSPHPLSHIFNSITHSDKQILLNAVSLSRTRLYSNNLQLPILIRAMGCERLDSVVKQINTVVGEGSLLDSVEILFGDAGRIESQHVNEEDDETAELFMIYNLRASFFIRWRRELGNSLLRREITDDVSRILHKSSLESACQSFQSRKLLHYFVTWGRETIINSKIRVFQTSRAFKTFKRAIRRRELISAIVYSRDSRSLTRIIRSWSELYVSLLTILARVVKRHAE
jgi:hypothetical protein